LYKDKNNKGYDPDNLINVSTGLRDPVEESSDDDREHKEVFTLGQISTRSQTKVSRYFTHTEVEADIVEARALKEDTWVEIDPLDNKEPIYDKTNNDDFNKGRSREEDAADINI
jgi:hypothetical protein